MRKRFSFTRRTFLEQAFLSGVAASILPGFSALAQAQAARPRVSLTAGDDRADIVFRALKPLGKEIAQAIGSRRVVIKPNNVSIEKQLAATHAAHLEGILEFLKSIGKLENAVIAESAANGPTMEGYDNFKYLPLGGKYNVKLVDLDKQGVDVLHVFDEKDFRPHAVRMSKMLLDRNNFIISAAKFKTHDRVVATLSLKNIVFGAPIKDEGFRWGKNSKAGAKTDKPIAHGSGFRGINYNLFALSQHLRPDLSVIDGFEGMEGNGPVGGTPVDHRVALASLDWFAADRVGVELMGIEFAKIGYLNYLANAGRGEPDLAKIDILGEQVANHIKPYKLSSRVDDQLIWMKPTA